MSGHTPGPWSLRISSKGYENKFQIQREDGACLFSFGDSPFHDDAEADARLIAVAPKLLDACRGFVEEYGLRCGPADDLDPAAEQAPVVAAAMRAIAEATGETP